jgi:hypothetical protein
LVDSHRTPDELECSRRLAPSSVEQFRAAAHDAWPDARDAPICSRRANAAGAFWGRAWCAAIGQEIATGAVDRRCR